MYSASSGMKWSVALFVGMLVFTVAAFAADDPFNRVVHYKHYTFTTVRNSDQRSGWLTILHNGKLLETDSGYAFRIEDSLLDKNILGKDKAALVVEEFTGGAHCCFDYTVYQLSPTFKRITQLDLGNFGGRFEDVDNDGQYELIAGDDGFAYWGNYSFVESPRIEAILRFRNGAFHLDAGAMRAKLPGVDSLEHIKTKLKSAYWNELPPRELWDVMLQYVYCGKMYEADAIYDEVVPANYKDKVKYSKLFKAQLKKCRFYHDVEALNNDGK